MNARQRKKKLKRLIGYRRKENDDFLLGLSCCMRGTVIDVNSPGGEVDGALSIKDIFKAREILDRHYQKSVSIPEWILGKRVFI